MPGRQEAQRIEPQTVSSTVGCSPVQCHRGLWGRRLHCPLLCNRDQRFPQEERGGLHRAAWGALRHLIFPVESQIPQSGYLADHGKQNQGRGKFTVSSAWCWGKPGRKGAYFLSDER